MNLLKFIFISFTFSIVKNFNLCLCEVNTFKSSFHNFNCNGDSNENGNTEIVQSPAITITEGKPRLPQNITDYEITEKHITGLQCNYTKPIEWVFYTTKPFNFKDELVAANNYFGRVFEEIGNVSVTIYQADINLFYDRSAMKSLNITVVCEAIEAKNPCEKSYLKYNPVSSKFDIPYQPFLLTSFPVSVRAKNQVGHRDNRECNATILIQQGEENQIIYKWETVNNSKITKRKHFAYYRPVNFWSAFKNLENDFVCYEYSSTLRNCTNNCKTVNYSTSEIGKPDGITNALAFYAEVNGAPIVLKGLFTIQKGNDFHTRKFVMEEEVKFSDMMHLELPFELMYTEKEYLIICWVSTFYFAVGTIISINEDTELIIRGGEKSSEVFNKHNSSRMVTRTIKFTSEYANTNQNLTCLAPHIKNSDWYQDSKSIYVKDSSFPKYIGIPNDHLFSEKSSTNFTIPCAFQGVPTPEISWELPLPELQKFVIKFSNETDHISGSNITFPSMMTNFTGRYKCTGSNFRGNVSKTFTVDFPPNELSHTMKMSLGISIWAAMFLFISVLLLLFKRLQLEKRLFHNEATKALKEFREGCSKEYTKDIFDVRFSVYNQPYNPEYEVPLPQWNIGTRQLGFGEFGVVRQGTVQIETTLVKVAIKIPKRRPTIAEFKSFLDELKVMAYLGVHENIARLAAAFSEDNDDRRVLIGVEFCDNGSLKDYVEARKEKHFLNMVTPEGFLKPDFNENTIRQSKVESPQLTTANLYTWSYQIANGLEYLEQKKVIHSDLATRNILLSARIEAKISDFGLSRILQNAQNYTKKTMCLLPWKSMAIESLRDLEFSTHSDMWAYGVTLWELYSLCESPWEEEGIKFEWNGEFIEELIKGLRLKRPLGGTRNIYHRIMLPTWDPIPEQRPRPTEVKEFFRDILEGND